MRAHIFLNGEFDSSGFDINKILTDDVVIAVDGGARHCLGLGINPSVLIGDLDSISESDLESVRASGGEVIKFPTEKDKTDFELALDYVFSLDVGLNKTKECSDKKRGKSVDEVKIYAALGGRFDMSLSNLLSLASVECKKIDIAIEHGNETLKVLHQENENILIGKIGETLSLIPINGDVRQISTSGLKYSLDREDLVFGRARGVSNQLISETVTVNFESGILLCIRL